MPITNIPLGVFPPVLTSESQVVPLAVASTSLIGFAQLVLGPAKSLDELTSEGSGLVAHETMPLPAPQKGTPLTPFLHSLAQHIAAQFQIANNTAPVPTPASVPPLPAEPVPLQGHSVLPALLPVVPNSPVTSPRNYNTMTVPANPLEPTADPASTVAPFLQSLALHRVTASLPGTAKHSIDAALEDEPIVEDEALAPDLQLDSPRDMMVFNLAALVPVTAPVAPLAAAPSVVPETATIPASNTKDIRIRLEQPASDHRTAVRTAGELAFAARVTSQDVGEKAGAATRVLMSPALQTVQSDAPQATPAARILTIAPVRDGAPATDVPPQELAASPGDAEVANHLAAESHSVAAPSAVPVTTPNQATDAASIAAQPMQALMQRPTRPTTPTAVKQREPQREHSTIPVKAPIGSPIAHVPVAPVTAAPETQDRGSQSDLYQQPPQTLDAPLPAPARRPAVPAPALSTTTREPSAVEPETLTPMRPEQPFVPVSAPVHAIQTEALAPRKEIPLPAVTSARPVIETPVLKTDPRHVTIQLQAGQQDVQVHLMDRGGNLHVAVRTPDTNLASDLRQDLGNLVDRLESAGYRSETWTPETSTIPELRVASSSESTLQGDSPSGESGHQPSGQEPQDQPPRRHRPHWLQDFEDSLTQ